MPQIFQESNEDFNFSNDEQDEERLLLCSEHNREIDLEEGCDDCNREYSHRIRQEHAEYIRLQGRGA